MPRKPRVSVLVDYVLEPIFRDLGRGIFDGQLAAGGDASREQKTKVAEQADANRVKLTRHIYSLRKMMAMGLTEVDFGAAVELLATALDYAHDNSIDLEVSKPAGLVYKNFKPPQSTEVAALAAQAELRLLIDHSSLEVFGNDGALTMSVYVLPDPGADGLSLSAASGECAFRTLRIGALRSARIVAAAGTP